MIEPIPPFFILILGACLIPFIRGSLKLAYLLLIPVATFINILLLKEGTYWIIYFLNYELVLLKIDKLSLAFGYIFAIVTFIGNLYALHVRDDSQHVAAMIYSGSALGAVFAGDFITLFIFWEIMALAATYLIWTGKTKNSYKAGMRYLAVHLFGGLCLLIGIMMYLHSTGSSEFRYVGLNSVGSYFILIGFGVNAAFPILHAWLPDAYPESTFSGTVFLSAFTTKTAVYVLTRAFAGSEILIWIGVVMTAFPIFYAVIENNLRRVLSYSLINQVGFMVTGVGIGTALSINGAVAHAFCHILYKALLFMSMGAVLHQTGKINATDLGGLYKTMPLTTVFCIIGAASISGFPLTSGFVSKSMIVSAAAVEGMAITWFGLLFASAGVFHHSGIKIPYFAFFCRDSGIRTKEPPVNMLLAMGIAAFFCISIGVFPDPLYSILPYSVDYIPYTATHVVDHLQLLCFSALAFILLLLSGLYPSEIRAINLDTDWLYRKGAEIFIWFINKPGATVSSAINRVVFDKIPTFLGWLVKNPILAIKIIRDSLLLAFSIPEKREEIRERLKAEKKMYPGDPNAPMPLGILVLWAIFFLLVYLIIYYSLA
ncbi:MAG: Na(+)/H(+) antiporter subunit D [Thermodesulfovibrio sp.]|nr:Na(+)/H(+) antiporter subunit D [Thermodesulfovibrio sp.]